jgi:hypothetical protein
MNVRKLLDWRKVLIYTHRWMGIVFGLIFITWFLSGVVFMYVGMPQLSETERLGHMKPLSPASIRISPADASRRNQLAAGGFKIESYYDGRPVYRFGNRAVYADTGDLAPGANALQAVDLIRRWVPEYARTVKYDAYLEDSDQWTLQRAQRQFMPVHRIAVGDPAGTIYYVSEATGEPIMKTDRRGRFWGFWSAVLHWTYFTPFRRQTQLWNQVITWGSIVGALMCLSGIVIGVWRLAVTPRFRRPGGILSHSPYAGWMWWHHYAGLIFGFLSCTWAFSGALSLGPFQVLKGRPVTQAQRRAVSGGRSNLDAITVDRIRASIAAFAPSFAPKGLEYLQFRGEPYFIATCPPSRYEFNEERGSNAGRHMPPSAQLIVSALHPEEGTFKRFDNAIMEKIAAEAMPGVPIQDSTWLNEYDSYYYNHDGLKSLPVLRVRYADAEQTWLYFDPQHGTMTKQDRHSRLNRWLYHGFHSLDFPFLYYRRPLWDIVVIFFSVGGIVLSATTLAPAWHRLMRHARRVSRIFYGGRRPLAEALTAGITGDRSADKLLIPPR